MSVSEKKPAPCSEWPEPLQLPEQEDRGYDYWRETIFGLIGFAPSTTLKAVAEEIAKLRQENEGLKTEIADLRKNNQIMKERLDEFPAPDCIIKPPCFTDAARPRNTHWTAPATEDETNPADETDY